MQAEQFKTYQVKKLKEAMAIDANWDKPQWQGVDPLELSLYMGDKPDHFPKVQAKLLYDDSKLYVIFRVEDKYVRALATKYQDTTCRDSCVEFFFTPTATDDPTTGYFNFELNCIGTVLCYHQKSDAENEIHIKDEHLDQMEIASSLPKKVIDPEITDPVTWTLEYTVPYTLLENYHTVVKPAAGVQWRGNLYKCADRTSGQHWLTWSLVDLPRPDFHRPKFFGTLEFLGD